MRKRRLVVTYSYDFRLFGINSSLKDFKIAWNINQQLKIKLVKKPDYTMSFLDQSQIVISNYHYETEYCSYRLIKNRSVVESPNEKPYLVPELRDFDYFLMISDQTDSVDIKELLEKVKKIKGLDFVTELDTTKLKSRENLLLD